jgi:hypothetical protein
MVSIFDAAATCWSQVCELLVASMRPDPPKDAMLDGYLISGSLVCLSALDAPIQPFRRSALAFTPVQRDSLGIPQFIVI